MKDSINTSIFKQEVKAVCQKLVFACLLLIGTNSYTLANDLVKQYSAELLLYESNQITEKTVFNYAHPVFGNDLRRLLDANRASLVIDAFISAKISEGEKTEVPNLVNQFGSIHRRIERAFNAEPNKYEEEYLDSLTWSSEFIVRSNAASRDQFSKPMPEIPGMSASQLKQFIESMQGLQNTLITVAAQSLQQQIEQGKFSDAGVVRANKIVSRFVLTSFQPNTPFRTSGKQYRTIANGKQVYEAQCVACHAAGIAGSPRFGDRVVWRPRLNQGLEKLIESTLRGKGAMGAQGGGDFQDFEIARSVVYLANSAGASFNEPPVPANQPSLIEVKVRPLPPPRQPDIPYPLMNSAEKLHHGEKVYFANCVACHQVHGQGAGTAIPPLAPSAKSMSPDKLIQIMLNGQNGGRMPSWRHLQNTEIASVVNYMRIKFGGKADSDVQPDQVDKFRK
jgi:cytochrome c5